MPLKSINQFDSSLCHLLYSLLPPTLWYKKHLFVKDIMPSLFKTNRQQNTYCLHSTTAYTKCHERIFPIFPCRDPYIYTLLTSPPHKQQKPVSHPPVAGIGHLAPRLTHQNTLYFIPERERGGGSVLHIGGSTELFPDFQEVKASTCEQDNFSGLPGT